MKKSILAFLILVLTFPTWVQAASLVADVSDPNCDQVTFKNLPLQTLITPVVPGKLENGTMGRVGIISLEGLPSGTYTTTATCQNVLWGLSSADSSPFTFVRPTSISIPGTPRLVP